MGTLHEGGFVVVVVGLFFLLIVMLSLLLDVRYKHWKRAGWLDWDCLVDHVGRVRWERGGGNGRPPSTSTHTHMYTQSNE